LGDELDDTEEERLDEEELDDVCADDLWEESTVIDVEEIELWWLVEVLVTPVDSLRVELWLVRGVDTEDEDNDDLEEGDILVLPETLLVDLVEE